MLNNKIKELLEFLENQQEVYWQQSVDADLEYDVISLRSIRIGLRIAEDKIRKLFPENPV